tara:strand:- start:3250 stop:3498 length:249 start_codon:yes stop_codon:yes gene_type:complete
MKRSESIRGEYDMIFEQYRKITENNPQGDDIDWFEVVSEEGDDETSEAISHMRDRIFDRVNNVSCTTTLQNILDLIDQHEAA